MNSGDRLTIKLLVSHSGAKPVVEGRMNGVRRIEEIESIEDIPRRQLRRIAIFLPVGFVFVTIGLVQINITAITANKTLLREYLAKMLSSKIQAQHQVLPLPKLRSNNELTLNPYSVIGNLLLIYIVSTSFWQLRKVGRITKPAPTRMQPDEE